MARKYRPERIGEEIRRLISDLIRKEIQDPRLEGIVSIATVDVSSDHSYATVYISMLGSAASEEASAEQKQAVLDAFQSAKGLIRKTIGREMRLRHTPELTFRIDTSMEYGRHMDRVLSDLGLAEGEPESERAAEPETEQETAPHDK